MGYIAVIINALMNLDMHHAQVIAKVIRKGQKVQNKSLTKKIIMYIYTLYTVDKLVPNK